MAVTYNSTQTSTGGAACTKPTGTVESDLLIAYVVGVASTDTFTAPSDTVPWNALTRVSNPGGPASQFFWKLAGSAEPSSYTFSSANMKITAIGRVTGHDLTTPINTSLGTSDTSSSKTITLAGITPGVANCMLLFCTAFIATSATVSGYAIVTSNPSWTEQVDQSSNPSTLSIASATRSQTTATGNGTALYTTGDAADTRKTGYLVAIAPGSDTTISADLLGMTEGTGDPAFYVDYLNMTESIFDPVTNTWSTQPKHSSSWVDQTKH